MFLFLSDTCIVQVTGRLQYTLTVIEDTHTHTHDTQTHTHSTCKCMKPELAFHLFEGLMSAGAAALMHFNLSQIGQCFAYLRSDMHSHVLYITKSIN